MLTNRIRGEQRQAEDFEGAEALRMKECLQAILEGVQDLREREQDEGDNATAEEETTLLPVPYRHLRLLFLLDQMRAHQHTKPPPRQAILLHLLNEWTSHIWWDLQRDSRCPQGAACEEE